MWVWLEYYKDLRGKKEGRIKRYKHVERVCVKVDMIRLGLTRKEALIQDKWRS